MNKKTYTQEDFQFIDLGLPSGTLWAKENAPGFFTFDEAKEQFSGILPETAQFQELYDECEWQWLNKEDAPNGIAGYRITGPNGNYIFIEASGNPRNGVDNESVVNVDIYGNYWSATYDKKERSRLLFFFDRGVYPRFSTLCAGAYCVRPVVPGGQVYPVK